MEPFLIPKDLEPFALESAQWPRPRDAYRAPLLLVKEFLRGGRRPITAVADRDIVYTDAYFGAAVDAAHSEKARLAAAILSSSLASWFFLLTAAEFGVWKRRLLTNDVRNQLNMGFNGLWAGAGCRAAPVQPIQPGLAVGGGNHVGDEIVPIYLRSVHEAGQPQT